MARRPGGDRARVGAEDAANDEEADAPSAPAAVRGQEVFFEADCASCHTVRGSEADGTGGPDLTHLASRETIAAATLPRTRRNLLDWITDPHAIKRGVDMPATDLSAEEMDALLTYLAGLR